MTPNDAKEDKGHSDVHLDLPSSSRLFFFRFSIPNYPILNAQNIRIKIKIKIKIKGLVYFSHIEHTRQSKNQNQNSCSKVKNED
jgi:hypothetical protein